MKWSFLITIALLSLKSKAFCQNSNNLGKGVAFENALTWEEVKQKAKRENKFIFVDCFATWCAPCKLMDKQVYAEDSVGDYMNRHFISIRLQMDSTKLDDGLIKQWYPIASSMIEKYNVRALPTYLFFSPEGIIVHKAVGFKITKDFLELSMFATDSSKQYYTAIAEALAGRLLPDKMIKLVYEARAFKDTGYAREIAMEYIHDYLESLPEKELFTKENLESVNIFKNDLSSKDKIFNQFYHFPIKIDSVVNEKGFAEMLVKYVIYKEEVTPMLNEAKLKATAPNWNKIFQLIKKKYGKACAIDEVIEGKIKWSQFKQERIYKEEIAPRLEIAKENGIEPDWDKMFQVVKEKYNKKNAINEVIEGKVRWYKSKQEWNEYVKYLIQKVDLVIKEKHDRLINPFDLNNWAWDIFSFSKRKKDVKKALSLINTALQTDAHNSFYLDTKANILYKLGRDKEAIKLEEAVVSLGAGEPVYDIAKKNLNNMKNGLPTWYLK